MIKRFWIAALLLSPVLFAAEPGSPDLRTSAIVDLTHPFDEKTLYWPTSAAGFQLTRLAYGEVSGGWFYSSYSFCAPEHGGTHLDAPIHFARNGRTADQIPARQLVAPGAVIDVARQAEKDPDYRLTAADVRAWESRHGTVPAGAIVLLRTGWGKRWPDRKRYFGDDTPNDATKLHFPSYGKEAAELLVRERRVGALGVDPPRSTPVRRRTSSCIRSRWERRSRASRTSRTSSKSPRAEPGSSPSR